MCVKKPNPYMTEEWKPSANWAQQQATMNMRRDEWGVMNVYAALNPPKTRTNAIGIPLIKWTGRFDA